MADQAAPQLSGPFAELADEELASFSAGQHPRPWRLLGAHLAGIGAEGGVGAEGGARLSVWAPNARSVSVVSDEGRTGTGRWAMRRHDPSGVWTVFVAGLADGDRYRYAVEGPDGKVTLKADPMARWSELRPGTASRIDSSSHAWADDAWLQRRSATDPHRAPMRIYEVHLGSWRRRPDGSWLTYGEIGDQLAEHCRRFGFTHVELMPIAEHPFDGSWGYQVTAYYAPTSRFGRPDGLRAMIDTLHQAGIGVLLDWVPAHFPRDEHALARFDGTPLYEHADPMRGEHPDWGTLIFDFERPQVRNFLIGNARYWLEEFHVDGLRVDAVASMLYLDYSRRPGQWRPNVNGGRENLEAIAFIRDLNDAVHAAAPDTVTVAEESTAFDGVTRPTSEGGLGFDLKWDMGWMHDTLDYFARPPAWRGTHQHRITFRGVYLRNERWVLPLSHDEVVYLKRSLLGKMNGDEAQRFASLRSLLANQVGQPGKKLLFMGSELAPAGEWNHDGELPWRAAEEDPMRVRLARFMTELGELYASAPALWEADEDPDGFRWIDIGDPDGMTFAWLRRGATSSGATDLVVVVQNLGPTPRRRYWIGLPVAGRWRVALNTDAERYGGASHPRTHPIAATEIPRAGMPASAVLTLPPLGTLFLRPEGG
jgi:1,4-alpha-glucan branching enzyme